MVGSKGVDEASGGCAGGSALAPRWRRLAVAAAGAALLPIGLAWPATTRTFPGAAPCNTLQGCINASAAGDTISITASASPYLLPEISVTKSLTLSGAGAGAAAVVLKADGAHRVLHTAQNLAAGVTLSKLTITGGACASGTSQLGGGIFADAGTPLTLDSVDVTSNTCSTNSGGGIYVAAGATLSNVNVAGNTDPGGAGGGLRAGADVTVTGGSFSNNSSFNSGGGMRVTGALTMTGVQVSGNFHTNTAAGANGGGIRADGGATLTNCSVHDNTTTNLGGGLYATSATISGGSFETNSAIDGGGVYATGTLSVTDTLIEANTATGDGAGIYAASPGVTTLTGTDSSNHTKFALFIGNIAGGSGGGVFASGAVQLVGKSVFTNNQATVNGGAIAAASLVDLADPTLGATFESNAAGGNGGAIEVSGSLSLVNRPVFTTNTATTEGGGAHSGGAMTLAGAVLSSNSARRGGGLSSGATLSLTASTLTGNQATIEDGGGLLACCGFATLTDVAFDGNHADRFGGGASLLGAQIVRSSFVGNTAVDGGGGAYVTFDAELLDCTLSGNSAVHGGALNVNFPDAAHTLNVFGSLFYDNSGISNIDDIALTRGGATLINDTFARPGAAQVAVLMGAQGIVDARNDIFAGYTAAISGSGPLTEDYNDFFNAPLAVTGSVTSGGHSVAADPKFIDSANANFRLQAGSPLIDAGDDSALPAALTTDLDGRPRQADVPSVPDTGVGPPPVVDLGAYELNDEIFADGFDTAM